MVVGGRPAYSNTIMFQGCMHDLVCTSAIPPAITATEPFLRMRLNEALVAGTLPIQAMKWRHPLGK